MADQTLLLIDPNAQNLSVMEVQLRKHGYEVVTAGHVDRALQLIGISPPDLIICEFHLDGGQTAIELCSRLKSEVGTKSTPFLIITDQEETRVDCLTAGADDVLIKPVYMAELKDRSEFLLQRRKRVGLEQGAGQRFFGRLEEMGLLDLLQVIDVSQRSGKLIIEHKSESGALWFQEGALHDAEMGHLKGINALHRLLTWEFGQYEFDFKAPPRPNVLKVSLEQIKSEGLKHIDQWNKMCEQLPPLETIFRHDPAVLAERAEPLERLLKKLITRFDGQKTALDVINASPEADLDVLQGLTMLYFEGLIYEVREALSQSDTPDPVFIDPQGTMAPPPPVELDDTPYIDEFDSDEEGLPPPVTLPREDEDMPEEGQDLLAELYAAPSETEAPDYSPPPIPADMPEETDQADETYSTLFGLDGSFDYADEEAAFFEGMDDADEDPFGGAAPLEQEVSGSAKAFWLLLVAAVIGSIVFAMQDRVYPLKLTVTAEGSRNWYVSFLNERDEFFQTKPVEGEWEISVSDAEVMLTELDEPVALVKEGSSSPKSKRKVGTLLKQAQALKSKGGEENWRKAAELVKQALGLQPKSKYGLLLSASLHMELAEDRKALQRLQLLRQLDPKYGNAKVGGPMWGPGVVYTALGNTYQQLGRDQEAMKYYEDYLRSFPDGPQSREIRRLVRELKNRGR